MARIYGDPGRVAEEAAGAEMAKALRDLEEALETARRLLEDKRRSLLRKALERVGEAYMDAVERLRSEEAKLELGLRTRVTAEKNRYLDMVMERLREEVRRAKAGASWYEAYMRRVLEAVASEAGEYGGFIVRVAPEDRDLARRLAAGLEGVEVSEEPADILGGAIAVSRDGSVTLDYSLDYIIAQADARLRSVAARVLFG